MRLPALYDGQRAVIFRWGMLLAAAACALAPLSGASSATPRNGVAGARIRIGRLAPLGVPSPIALKRDPFIPRAAELPSGTVVEAVLLGESPHALISVGAQTAIVGVGDAVAGIRIQSIDARGVRLADGTRLWLRGAAP